jgi:hypothetical protein
MTGHDFIWAFRVAADEDIAGYEVVATDGAIGHIDDAVFAEGASHIIVDTGFWILGRHSLLPAGVVERIDRDERRVYVDRTKEQVKNAPDYPGDLGPGDAPFTAIGAYYAEGGRGARPIQP